MSEIGPASDKEVVQVKAEPVLVETKSRETHLAWLGAVLAFAGREIVPRLAASLLNAWDRRASRPASPSGDLVSGQPIPSMVTNLPREGGQRRRRQRRGS
jgi:hypothetical protein